MMFNRKKRGFTLIELLIVIAIIGILATILLANLGDSRDEAINASARTTMSGLRSEAELFYNQNNFRYTGLCDPGGDFINRLNTTAQLVTDGATGTCAAGPNEWAAHITLRGGGTFCVDSTGRAAEGSTVSGFACN